MQTPGIQGGTHVSSAPLTLSETAKAAPELLRNAIDRRIVKIRPMSTPVDQISRMMGARHASSMEVEYYSVDTKLTESTLKADCDLSEATDRGNGTMSVTMRVEHPAIFEPSETVLIPDCPSAGEHTVGYVLSTNAAAGSIDVAVVGEGEPFGLVSSGSRIIRMGRAAAELDVQTAQFAALPQKDSNHCQIFKMQVEQSTLAKIAEKEVGWNFSDQEEAAIIDMRLGMEKNFIFGKRARLFDAAKNEHVYFTGGIWQQAARSHTMPLGKLTEADLIDLCSAAFTGNSGSKRKILIAGTGLVEALSKLQYTKTVSAGDTFTKWGIEFKEIRSNFGSLYLLHSEVFDQCGHANDGFVLDPDYMTKYVHVPFQAETLDLRRSGQRNTDAVVLTEASCLVLRYPAAHIRVIGQTEEQSE